LAENSRAGEYTCVVAANVDIRVTSLHSFTFATMPENTGARRFCFLAISIIIVANMACIRYPEPDTALDCGRQFVLSVYNGNFKRAAQLVEQNGENVSVLHQKFEAPFHSSDSFVKDSLSQASLIIHRITAEKDGGCIIFFQNALTQQPDSFRVIADGEKWRVRLSKTFQ